MRSGGAAAGGQANRAGAAAVPAGPDNLTPPQTSRRGGGAGLMDPGGRGAARPGGSWTCPGLGRRTEAAGTRLPPARRWRGPGRAPARSEVREHRAPRPGRARAGSGRARHVSAERSGARSSSRSLVIFSPPRVLREQRRCPLRRAGEGAEGPERGHAPFPPAFSLLLFF